MNSIKLIIADAQHKFANKLSVLLNSLDGLEVAGKAADSKALLRMLDRLPCQVLIMDMHLPEADVLELTKLIKTMHPRVHILLLSLELKTSLIMDALQAGASGYLLKTAELSEIQEAILKIEKGQIYLSDYQAREIAGQYRRFFEQISRQPSATDLTFLSDREKQILELIALEFANNEIATRLYISTSTVETHRKHLIKKLGVRNSLGLVKYALRIGLINLY
jgi:DNA-binding NarL/FixJ family response regulator